MENIADFWASFGVPLESAWRIMAQINTSKDPITIKIPVYDDNIQQLIKSCGGYPKELKPD